MTQDLKYGVTVTVRSLTLGNLLAMFKYVAEHVREGNTMDYKWTADTGGNDASIKYDLPPEGFKVGDKVKKVSGYAFDGIVVAVFQNSIGQTRYVVEHRTIVGLLHIFNAEQLDHR